MSLGPWRAAAAVRYVRLQPRPGTLLPATAQQETYLHAGFASPSWGLEAHGALLFGDAPVSSHVGILGRVSPGPSLGTITADVTRSLYPDGAVLRVAGTWRLPLSDSFDVAPGIAFQYFADGPLANIALTLFYARGPFGVWLGGKYGDEVRPAYLAQFVVYDIDDRIAWGVWAGARVHALRGLDVFATYSLDRLRIEGTQQRSNMHSLTLGPVMTF
jgi:hypothetical protein